MVYIFFLLVLLVRLKFFREYFQAFMKISVNKFFEDAAVKEKKSLALFFIFLLEQLKHGLRYKPNCQRIGGLN